MGATKVTHNEINNRQRKVRMQIGTVGGTGVAMSYDFGPQVAFSGTPGEFARGHALIPTDYVAGTDVYIQVHAASSTNQTISWNYYVASHREGMNVATNSWNVHSNLVVGGNAFVTNSLKRTTITVPAASVQAGDSLAIAIKPSAAITGGITLYTIHVEYTADS